MIKLVILFKSTTQTATFDLDLSQSLVLLNNMPGVQGIHTSLVLGGPASQPPYHRIVEVLFETFEALDAALTSPEGVAAGKNLITFAGTEVDILFAELQDDSTRPFTAEHLQAYLDKHQIAAEIVRPGRPTPTVASAASVLGVDQDQIVKSVLFLVENRPFLVLGCGTRRVEPGKLAERLAVERTLVRLANPDEVLAIAGYKVGTVPPFGFRVGKIPTYMDPAVQAYETIYAGGGGIDALLRINSADLLRITHAEIAPLLAEKAVLPRKSTDTATASDTLVPPSGALPPEDEPQA